MGTISEKLTYLNGTKQELKQKINNLGGNITSETTFREYAEELQDVYDNLPKTEYQQGAEVNLGKTIKGKLDYENGVVGIGQTEQDSTEGYNLLDVYNNMDSGTASGLTYKINVDGIVSITGTATNYSGKYSKGGFNSTTPILTLKANHTYRILLEVANNTGSVRFYMGPTSQNPYYISNITTNGVFTQDYTISEDVTITQFSFIGGQTNNVQNNCIMKVALIDITNKEYNVWEPYTNGTSPNPSYPQTINSVTGTQNVVVSGKNELEITATNQTKNNVEFTINSDKSIKANGTANGSSGLVIGQVQLKANETYLLSGCASNGGSGKYTLSINEEDSTTRLVDDTGSGATYTPTTSGTYDIRLNYWYGFNIQNLVFYPMLRKSNITDDTYEPYITPTSYQLSLGDIELCKIGDYKDYIYKSGDKWYVHKEIGKVVFTGASSESWEYDSGNSAPFTHQFEKSVNYSPSLSNYFINSENVIGVNNKFGFNSSGTTMWVKCTSLFNSASDFTTWLATHNLKVYYILATSTNTEITDTSLINQLNAWYNAHSNNGTTIITSNGNLPMIIKVRGLKGE